MFTKLDRYIMAKYLGTFFFALFLFLAIAIVIDATERINDFLRSSVGIIQIVGFYLNWLPYIAGLLAPMFVFIAVIFFTSKLASQSEIVAILSSGISFRRFVLPYLIVAAFLTMLFWLFNNYFIPYTNKKKVDFELQFLKNKKRFRDKNFHFKIGNEWYAYVEDYNIDERTGYKFALEKIEKGTLTYKLRADKISYDTLKKTWKIYNGIARINTDNKEYLRYMPELDTTLNFKPDDIYTTPESKSTLNTPRLKDFVVKEKAKGIGGEDLKAYEVEIYDRTNIPLSTFILTLIGVSVASRKMRGGMGLHIGIGMSICSIYILFQRFAMTFAVKGDLHPFIASCIPNTVFLIVALVLFWRAPK